jgi:hypothetical protein
MKRLLALTLAVSLVGGPAAPAAGAALQVPLAGPPQIGHTPMTCLPAAGNPVAAADVTAQAPVQKSRVYFKAHQYPDWYYIDMKAPSQPHYYGLLPEPLPETQKIDYYIHAFDTSLQTSRTDQYEPVVLPNGCPESRPAGPGPAPGSESQIIVGGTKEGQAAIPPGFSPKGIIAFITVAGALISGAALLGASSAAGGSTAAASGAGAAAAGGGGGMSGGAVAGIVVGGVALVGGGAYLGYKALSDDEEDNAVPCNQSTKSGGAGVTTTEHGLGKKSGTFTFQYNAYIEPDRFEIIYEGKTILNTGNVSGSGSRSVSFSGSSKTATVRVTGSSSTTVWDYTLYCP